MNGKAGSGQEGMAATSTLETEVSRSEEEERMKFFSHTQQVRDVFILVQKQLSRQGFYHGLVPTP